MATKPRTPRLGRGLSSMFATPVPVTPAPVAPPAEQPEPGATEQSAPTAAAVSPAKRTPPKPVSSAGPKTKTAAKSADMPKETSKTSETDGQQVALLPAGSITPNPHQPRQRIADDALQRLAASIRQEGVMQPIIVRPMADQPGRYELVAGERRWRAAQIAGLQAVPALVRDLNQQQLAEWALIENLQREDLDPIERAQAFEHLINHFKLSHEDLGRRVGVDRSTISNTLRLLLLDDQVRRMVQDQLITAGHARALAGVTDRARQLALAQRVVREQWSVRRLEQAIRDLQRQAGQDDQVEARPARAAHLDDLEQQIARQIGTRVRIRPGRKKGSGTLTIDFYSIEQFDALMGRLNVDVDGQ